MIPATNLLLIVLVVISVMGCKPERPASPNTPAPPVDGRIKFLGIYDVYDTSGNWLYEMNITLHPGSIIDSLFIQNWGGNFDVYVQHDDLDQSNFLHFIGGFGLPDHNGYRWALYAEYDSLFKHNRLINDTLRLSYEKNNIAFYVSDGVPYFQGSYREYAVKRE